MTKCDFYKERKCDMRIVTKQEFTKYPDGTVFMTYKPDCFSSELRIKTGQYVDNSGWNGELSIEPYIKHDLDVDNYCYMNWCTVDTSSCDYDDDQLFAVFSNTEVRKMIDGLQWALTGCKSYFNQDEWFYDDCHPLDDETVEQM